MPKVKAKNTITDSQRTLTKDVGSIMEILITGGCGFSKRDMLYLVPERKVHSGTILDFGLRILD